MNQTIFLRLMVLVAQIAPYMYSIKLCCISYSWTQFLYSTMASSSGTGTRHRNTTRQHSVEDQALNQVAAEVCGFVPVIGVSKL